MWTRIEQGAELIRKRLNKNDSIVGICLERSVECVVLMLATLRAGATYYVIDSHYPSAYKNIMVESVDTDLLIGRSETLHGLQHDSAIILDLGHADNTESHRIEGNEFKSDLAYLILTSGSTGRLPMEVPYRAL